MVINNSSGNMIFINVNFRRDFPNVYILLESTANVSATGFIPFFLPVSSVTQ